MTAPDPVRETPAALIQISPAGCGHGPDRGCVDCATDDEVAAAIPAPAGGAR